MTRQGENPAAHMYKAYYGFKENPFRMTPDPACFFMGRDHTDAYRHLEYALEKDRGFMVVTGEPGSGKTSLVNLLLREQAARFTIGVLNPKNAQTERCMETICRRFGLDVTGVDTAETAVILRDFLLRKRSAGRRVILIVDDAQNLTDAAIEEIRMLANLEAERRYLMQIILVGRPELRRILQKNRVREFVQRVTVSCHLNGLGRDEIGRYIRHRLRYAGGGEDPEIFDSEAVDSIYGYSGGIPRAANIISEAALIYGYADELKTIGKRVVEDVVTDGDVNGIPIGETHPRSTPPTTVRMGMDGGGMDPAIRRDIEKKIHAFETTLYRINQGLNIHNSAREDRNDVGRELAEILGRLENRLALLQEGIRAILR
ncbi:MAG: AAA family ATPase [Deltaproteobacteria bacterium]|nr:AAA family ATPase [Deltaproteobacteria bacterium]